MACLEHCLVSVVVAKLEQELQQCVPLRARLYISSVLYNVEKTASDAMNHKIADLERRLIQTIPLRAQLSISEGLRNEAVDKVCVLQKQVAMLSRRTETLEAQLAMSANVEEALQAARWQKNEVSAASKTDAAVQTYMPSKTDAAIQTSMPLQDAKVLARKALLKIKDLPNGSERERAYRQLLRVWHPDKWRRRSLRSSTMPRMCSFEGFPEVVDDPVAQVRRIAEGAAERVFWGEGRVKNVRGFCVFETAEACMISCLAVRLPVAMAAPALPGMIIAAPAVPAVVTDPTFRYPTWWDIDVTNEVHRRELAFLAQFEAGDLMYEKIMEVRDWPSTSRDAFYSHAMSYLMDFRLRQLEWLADMLGCSKFRLTKVGTSHLLGERMRMPAIVVRGQLSCRRRRMCEIFRKKVATFVMSSMYEAIRQLADSRSEEAAAFLNGCQQPGGVGHADGLHLSPDAMPHLVELLEPFLEAQPRQLAAQEVIMITRSFAAVSRRCNLRAPSVAVPSLPELNSVQPVLTELATENKLLREQNARLRDQLSFLASIATHNLTVLPVLPEDMAKGTYRAVMCETISASASEGIEATVLRELPRKAQLGDQEVRISARAASLNFPELLMMQNKYQYKPKLPFVLCTEGAGVVAETGSKVSGLSVGDKVFYATMGGCAAEELVLPAQMCIKMPDTLSFSQGASFHMGYMTGYHGLVTRGRLKAGEWLLVTGAGGGMGSMAVELGKAVGAKSFVKPVFYAHDKCQSFSRCAAHERTRLPFLKSAMLSSVAGALIGAVVGWALASLQKTARPQQEYAEFRGLAALQKSLWTETSKETALQDGAKNRERLRAAKVLGKAWPVQMLCREADPSGKAPTSGKLLHFIRHGQGFHNSLNDFCKVYQVKAKPYNIPEVFDPPLTEIGRQQAKALQSRARETKAELVVVSPMSRALMTSNIAFAHCIGHVPFLAHESCKEKSHGNSCDYRRSASDAKQDFPNVDFSLIPEEDPLLSTLHMESDLEVAERAYDFMLWLRNRSETEIVVSTHSAWLFSLFNAVLKCDDPALSEWFVNGEMRSVVVNFQ
ncbi:unnamed protein product [Symbiodinium microadriaticum]|nr:unnamed protein product [Symbiodinium microadriaticum]